MPFETGAVAYARFHVSGSLPQRAEASLLDALREHALRPSEVAAGPELQAGWVAGRHVYDLDYAPETNLFGDQIVFGLRVDTNRVPAEIRRAYRAMAEAEQTGPGNGSFPGRAERAAAREEADRRCRIELAEGRHRRSRLAPVLLDLRRRLLLAPVFAEAPAEALRALVRTTFDASLEPLTSGVLAGRQLGARGRTREYEDLTPSRFTPAPPGAETNEDGEAARLSVAWSPIGAESKDYLGNELLIWLWRQLEETGGVIDTADGPVAAVIDRSLHAECAWNVTGRMALTADGPTTRPEAIAALRGGKWPRKAGLLLGAAGRQFTLTLQGDRFLVTGARLPRPEDAPASPRELIEDRLDALETLDRALVALYGTFLEQRTGGAWGSVRSRIAEWIAGRKSKALSPRERVGVRGARKLTRTVRANGARERPAALTLPSPGGRGFARAAPRRSALLPPADS